MNLPEKLPPVRGRGPLARSIARTWQTVNQIIETLQALQPRPGINTKIRQNSSGFSVEAQALDSSGTGDSSGGARWA